MVGFRLVFHREQGHASAFDAALREVVSDAPEVLLASPYIGLRYLDLLVGDTPFRLVTDIDEWLRSAPCQAHAIAAYVEGRPGAIRHLSGLHAKVAIGRASAFFGSANLTRAGLSQRDEMSAVITDAEAVAELRTWFEGMWDRAALPALPELQAIVRHLAEQRVERASTPRLTAKGERARAKLRLPALTAREAPRPVPALPTTQIPAVPAPTLGYSFKHPPSVFSALIRDLETQTPDSLQRAAEPRVIGAMFELLDETPAVGFKTLLRHLRKSDPNADSRRVAGILNLHCANGPVPLDSHNDGQFVIVGIQYRNASDPEARVLVEHMDAYLAWLLGRLSPDEYRPLPDSTTSAHFHITPEATMRLLAQLFDQNFVAADEAGAVVLTGEAAWGELPKWLPRFAAAWQKHGLSLDDPVVQPAHVGLPSIDPIEELVMYSIRALQTRPMPGEASAWPADPVGLLDMEGHREFLSELLKTELAREALVQEDGTRLVVFNPSETVALELRRNGMTRAADLVKAPNPTLRKLMNLPQDGFPR